MKYYQFNKYTLSNKIINCLKRPEFPRPICDFTLKRNSLMSMIYLYYNVDIIEVNIYIGGGNVESLGMTGPSKRICF